MSIEWVVVPIFGLLFGLMSMIDFVVEKPEDIPQVPDDGNLLTNPGL